MDLQELSNEALLDLFANASYWECEGWGESAEQAEVAVELYRAEILRRMK